MKNKESIEYYLDPSSYDEFLTVLAKESDRGCVLVGTELLNENLEFLLKTQMKMPEKYKNKIYDSLFNRMGLLESFSAKIKLSFSLNLIAEWCYKDLEIIRKLRNDFAHSLEDSSFEQDRIKYKVNTLHCKKNVAKLVTRGKSLEELVELNPNFEQYKGIIERLYFEIALSYICGHLQGIALFYQEENETK